MASSEDVNFNAAAAAACFRGHSKAQMSVGRNLVSISAAAAAPNSQPIRRQNEGLGGESLVVVRKLERKLLNIDLNVAPPEAAACELAEADGGGNGPETPPPDDSAKKAGVSDEGELNFNEEMKTSEISVDAEEEGRNRRWVALLEVAENALRDKKEDEIRSGKSGGEAANRKKIGGQRRQSLVAEWTGEVAAAAVVVRSTRGRAVAMPSKYRDSVLGSAAAAAAAEPELPRHHQNGKSAAVLFTKRKSR